jgi:hypothetical protein
MEASKWFLCHNGIDVFHYGFAEEGTALDSGQPIIELFDTEQEWLDELLKYGITPEEEEEI